MIEQETITKCFSNAYEQFEELCASYNDDTSPEKRTWTTNMGQLEVTLSRGEGFDKASSVYCDLEIETPPVLAEKTGQKGTKAKVLVLEINFYPVNPFIPRGYIELRTNSTNTLMLAGGTDIFPYFDDEDYTNFFANAMQQLCNKHRQNYENLQRTRADFFRSKYTGEKVGSHAGIYFMHLPESSFDFFCDMANTFFKAYRKLFEKHRAKSFDTKDKEYQKETHGRWAQWVLLEDEGTRYGLEKGIPPESLLTAILPPHAKF